MNMINYTKTTNKDSLQALFDSIPVTNTEETEIHLAPGTYVEKLEIKCPYVTIIGDGQSPEDTVLSFGDFAFDTMEDGTKRGTFRSYSLLIDADHVTLRNLTVENSSKDSATCGQAIALYAEGDYLLVDHCRLVGHQDTLFTGPLPPKELQPGGFIGPKQFAPRINGRQHYKNTYICGDVDFIFGSATAYFENCRIESLRRSHLIDSAAIQGYVTAPSTPQGQQYGYVFNRCQFISSTCPDNTVYLSRPWRDYAKAVFINCQVGAHIRPEGFHDWNKPLARENCYFATYGLTQFNPKYSEIELQNLPAFVPSCDFSQALSQEDLTEYEYQQVFASR